jgi:hypothetical protein
MQERRIPSTGQTIPVIGCGTWLGFDVGGTPQALPQRGEVLAALFAAGGSVVDSSPMYGSAEAVVGDLLHESATRAKAFLATKVWTTGKQAGIAQMERSMALLRTGHIELIQVHNLVDWRTHLDTLRAWKAQGRISYLGVTHYTESAYPELEQVMRAEPLDFVQFNYSIAARGAEQRLLPLAAERQRRGRPGRTAGTRVLEITRERADALKAPTARPAAAAWSAGLPACVSGEATRSVHGRAASDVSGRQSYKELRPRLRHFVTMLEHGAHVSNPHRGSGNRGIQWAFSGNFLASSRQGRQILRRRRRRMRAPRRRSPGVPRPPRRAPDASCCAPCCAKPSTAMESPWNG